MGELKGEEVRWDGAAAGPARQAGRTKGPMPGGTHRAKAWPALAIAPAVAFGLETCGDVWVVQPCAPALGGDPDRTGLAR